MRFTKYSEQELKSLNVLPTGTYLLTVIEATDDISKPKENVQQKEIIKLKLMTKNLKGRDSFVYCNLSEDMPHLIKHFCDCTGLSHLYDQEKLTAGDCIGRIGMMQLIVKKSTNPDYGDSNMVKDFLMEKATEAPIDQSFNDDIKF